MLPKMPGGNAFIPPSLELSDASRIDTSSMPPTLEILRRRSDPLDLNAAERCTPQPPLSPFTTARNIKRLQDIEYPEGVRSPQEDLNKDAKDGKFRYDRDFLMQFMPLCKRKPPNLPPLDTLGIEPVDQSTFDLTRGNSGQHRQSSGAMPPNARQSSVGLGISASFNAKPGATPGPFPMGRFSTPTSKLTSEERYTMATGTCSASVSSGPAAILFNRTAMTQTSSQGDPGGHPARRKRVRTKRAKRTGVIDSQDDPLEGSGLNGVFVFDTVLEPPAHPDILANRWVTTDVIHGLVAADTNSPELLDRKVGVLLSRIVQEDFDFISNQIIALVNGNEREKDGQTLVQVARLVYEKAIDDTAYGGIYARLCRMMMGMISPDVQRDGMKCPDGKPILGGQLFRKYLLSRCQEDFERGWVAKDAMTAPVATEAEHDSTDEKGGYCATQKAKRQRLGLIKFMGELFKLQMLTERTMHECVKKLLGTVRDNEEVEIESLCLLLETVGQLLDVPKARAHMDVYFTRMKKLGKSTNVSPRVQVMLQDVIELRDRKWVARGAITAPTTISAIHEAAAKEKSAAEQAYQRQTSVSRGGSRGGADHNAESVPDGWSVARPQPKASDLSDLSHFGKISGGIPMVMGPSSVFTKRGTKREPRISSSLNMFSMLSQNPELAVDTTVEPNCPPSWNPSVDLGQGSAPQPPRRKKLLLPPPSKSTPALSEDELEGPAPMSEIDTKKIEEDVKEFFAVRSMEEADVYFTNLPEEHRFHLVDKLVGSALESREADAVLVAEFFAQAGSKGQCSPEVFEAGFMPMAELLEDIAIDAPNAFKLMAIMLRGAGFGRDEERLARLAGKSMDGDKLLRLVSS